MSLVEGTFSQMVGLRQRMGMNGVTVLRDRCKSKLFHSFLALFCFRCLMPFNLCLFFSVFLPF